MEELSTELMVFLKAFLHIFFAAGLYYLGIRRVKQLAQEQRPHSLLRYYGFFLVISTYLPLLMSVCLCYVIDCSQISITKNVTFSSLIIYFTSFIGFLYGWKRMRPDYPVLKPLERLIKAALFIMASLAVLITFSIILSMLVESLKFFQHVPLVDFLLGTEWSPHALSATDTGSYGIIPLFTGALLITVIAMSIAIPLGLFTAIYLSQYASSSFKNIIRPILEILAGIPTVIYGFFAVIVVCPSLSFAGRLLNIDISSESALAAGIVMGVMILPYISSLSYDVLNAVPQALKEASLGMGATLSETIKYVLLPAAGPGVIAAILLAISRAIGETMLVVMAIGLTANFTFNPLDSVTTVTVQIVSLLTGDQSFDSPAPLSAFALGLTLFIMTFILNMIALKVVKSYREKYDF